MLAALPQQAALASHLEYCMDALSGHTYSVRARAWDQDVRLGAARRLAHGYICDGTAHPVSCVLLASARAFV